jgi:hypothetical protein
MTRGLHKICLIQDVQKTWPQSVLAYRIKVLSSSEDARQMGQESGSVAELRGGGMRSSLVMIRWRRRREEWKRFGKRNHIYLCDKMLT